MRTKHGRGFPDQHGQPLQGSGYNLRHLTELSSLTASSTMRRLGFFFFFGASPLHKNTIAIDRSNQNTPGLALLPRAPLANRARAQHAPIPRSCCESGAAAARPPRAVDSNPFHPTSSLRCAPRRPFRRRYPAGRRESVSRRAGRQQSGAFTPRTQSTTPSASSACSCAAKPARAAAKWLRAVRISFKRETAGSTVRGRDEASSARGRGARVEMRRPCGRAHTRLLLRHQWSPSLPSIT